MSKFTVCPPTLTGVKYCESYADGEAVTTPLLAAAAVTTSCGAVLPNFSYVDKTAAGPDWMNSFGSSLWCIVNAFLEKSRCSSSIGDAAAMLINKAEAAADSCSMKRMMQAWADFKVCSKRDQIALGIVWREPIRKIGEMGSDDGVLETRGKESPFYSWICILTETAGSPTLLDCDLFWWMK